MDRLLVPAVLAAVAVAGAAAAQPVAAQGTGEVCGAVLSALQRLGAAPRFHWKMSATAPTRRRPVEREEVVLDDVVYMTPDEGRWMKQRITSAERLARMTDELARNPISDCRPAGTDTLGDAAMLVYTYRQGNAAPKAREAGENTAIATKRIWVGADDGLPHLFKSAEGPVSVTMQVEYSRVEAPLP